MDPNPQAAVSPTPRRRVKKRFLIPGLLLVVLLGLILFLAVRGSWADTRVRNPSSSAQGTWSYVHKKPDGEKAVRCARVVDYPVTDVWNVITDFEHYRETFPFVRSTRATREPDGRTHLEGTLDAGMFGSWGFASTVNLERGRTKGEPGQSAFEASWNEPNADLAVNRGSWSLTPLDGDRTLIVYSLEVDVKQFPRFLIRNVLLDRLPTVVDAIQHRLEQTHAKP